MKTNRLNVRSIINFESQHGIGMMRWEVLKKIMMSEMLENKIEFQSGVSRLDLFLSHKKWSMRGLITVLTFVSLALGLALEATAQQSYAFTIARVKYDGGGDWYGDPESLPELLSFVRRETLVDVAPREEVVELSNDNLYSYPYVYLTGHGNVRWTSTQALRLRRYLERGGFLHIDDNYGLDVHIRRELKKVFPELELVELPFDHAIYHSAFQFPNGLPKVHEHDGKPPQGFALMDENDRVMVFYTYESDLGDGWEPQSVHEKPASLREASLQMGTNILVYAMTH